MKIRMLRDVMSELPLSFGAPLIAEAGRVYDATQNPLGAVAVVFDDGELLGVKPGEFEILPEAPHA